MLANKPCPYCKSIYICGCIASSKTPPINMTSTNIQLKKALAKMLPEHLRFITIGNYTELQWYRSGTVTKSVQDTELLHLCWLVEEQFTEDTDLAERYNIKLRLVVGTEMTLDYSEFYVLHATWQQRIIALCKVKGIEIV